MSARPSIVCLVAALGACAHPASPPLPKVVGLVRHLDGTSLPLGALRGRPAILFVFSTWSAPSLLDIPRLVALHQRNRERLHVLAVALDENRPAVDVFVDTFEPSFPVVLPDDRPRFVGPEGPLGALSILPTTALITAEGDVFGLVEGAWPPGALEDAIERLLAEDLASR